MNNINNMVGGKYKNFGEIEWFGTWSDIDFDDIETIENDLSYTYIINTNFTGYYKINGITSQEKTISGTWSIIRNKRDFTPEDEGKDEGKADEGDDGDENKNVINFSFYNNDRVNNIYIYKYIGKDNNNFNNFNYKGNIFYQKYQPYLEPSETLYLSAYIHKNSNVYKELLKIRGRFPIDNENYNPHITLLYIDFYKTDSKIIDKFIRIRSGGNQLWEGLGEKIKFLYDKHILNIFYPAYNNSSNYVKLGNFIAIEYMDNDQENYKNFIVGIITYIKDNFISLKDGQEITTTTKTVNDTEFVYFCIIDHDDNNAITELFAIRTHNFNEFRPHISIFSEFEINNIGISIDQILDDLKKSPTISKYLPMWKNNGTSTINGKDVLGCIDYLEINIKDKKEKIEI